LLLLRRTLKEKPEIIAKELRRRMLEESRVSLSGLIANQHPDSPEEIPDPFFWLEHRSRVTSHKANVNFGWILAGIARELFLGNHKAAEARTLLGLAGIEQVSLDRGSWVMAWQVQLQQDPPYQSFEHHSVDGMREPYSKLLDERWVEAMRAHVRDVEDMRERMKKLTSTARGHAPTDGLEHGHEERPAGKARGKGKLKKEEA
jgi:hypothetical protein